jgi:hypothetical protein
VNVGLARHQVLQVLHLLPEGGRGDVLGRLVALGFLELLLEGRAEVLIRLVAGDLAQLLPLWALVHQAGRETLLLGFQDGRRRLGDTGFPKVVVVWPRDMIILLFKLRVQLPVQGALREQAGEDLLESATTDPLDVLLVHRVAVL